MTLTSLRFWLAFAWLQDDVVCGVKIPAGSSIVMSSWSMHRREGMRSRSTVGCTC